MADRNAALAEHDRLVRELEAMERAAAQAEARAERERQRLEDARNGLNADLQLIDLYRQLEAETRRNEDLHRRLNAARVGARELRDNLNNNQ